MTTSSHAINEFATLEQILKVECILFSLLKLNVPHIGQSILAILHGSSSSLPSSPPAEKATARHDEAEPGSPAGMGTGTPLSPDMGTVEAAVG
jgi:hypothetical protein